MTQSGKEARIGGLAIRIAAFACLACAIGFAAALVVRLIIALVSMTTHFFWNVLPATFSAAWLPLALCALGGLSIGLWTKYLGGAPSSLEHVIAQVKKTGSYHVDSMPVSIVGFLLPLAFGGAIGPEAGLAGIIAALCSWIADTLRKAGYRTQALADITICATLAAVFGAPFAGIVAGDATYLRAPDRIDVRRSVKIALYACAAVGAFLGISLFASLTGAQVGLPRFGAAHAAPTDAGWMLLCIAAAYGLAFVYRFFSALTSRLSQLAENAVILKAVACGIVLGACGLICPLALFSGEEQLTSIIAAPQSTPAGILIVASISKALLTPLCLSFGWRGGHFFPCIFIGAAAGMGIASLTGSDPTLCAGICAGTFLACNTRKPLLSAALLLLCFPLQDVLWVVATATIGSRLPLPRKAHDLPKHS